MRVRNSASIVDSNLAGVDLNYRPWGYDFLPYFLFERTRY